MSKRKPNKPEDILDAAAELFATKPFHEVRLEDIAALAHVGKGTVYLHWSSKEEVYLGIIRRGFAAVIAELDQELSSRTGNVWEQIGAVVRALVAFARRHPGVYRIMRSGMLTPDDPELQRMRGELTERVCGVLESGVRSGELADDHPALTTQFILSFVRGAALYPPPGMTEELLVGHIMHVLQRGIAAGAPS